MSGDWTWHGGALAAAQRHFGGDARDWIDLSTGINPDPWPRANKTSIDWQRLPEAGALTALETAAATSFGVDPGYVCAVPGSEIGLRLTGRLIGGAACHVAPAYRTHGAMIAASAPVGADDMMQHGGTLILANPNNPDGRCLTPVMLAALLDRRDAESWLLVDEAFADGDPAASVAPLVGDGARLIVFRSFGKFFGLAGVRLGFVIAPRDIVAGLRDLLGAWPVSAAATAIGTAAYRDTGWIAATRAALPRRAAALDAMLARRGYTATGACPLFRLIETEGAGALFERLAHARILTRPFAERPDWLRLGLPADADALARLEAALD